MEQKSKEIKQLNSKNKTMVFMYLETKFYVRRKVSLIIIICIIYTIFLLFKIILQNFKKKFNNKRFFQKNE